ncbi:MAG: hypothetical protein HW400_150 [Candidatus Levybacteria bacterium]|nr:hypothetical protein [Candidatus Levybacteria bacterium]
MSYKEVSQRITESEKKEFATGIELVNSFVESLGERKLLPQEFSKPDLSVSPASFEIPAVSEELYMKTREALAKEGYTFIVDILPVSIGQMVTDKATSQHFGYVNPSENMRAIIPLQMEVVINPKKLRIKGSNSKSTDTQIEIIKNEGTKLKNKLPQEVKNLVSMHMRNASVLAQLDCKYQQETGKVLFTNWYGRTNDQIVSGHVAYVGRHAPASLLDVSDWSRGVGRDSVFAVPVVVLPRKLAI